MVLPRDKFMRPIIPRQKMDHEDEAQVLQNDIPRGDFATSQQFIRDQKAHVSVTTLGGLFKRDNWTVMGYKSVKGLINDDKGSTQLADE